MTSEPTDIQELGTLDLERQDLVEQIADRESDVRRHTLWAVLGVSPGAALPLLFTRDPLGPLALVVAVVFMTGFELWRLVGAKRDVAALKQELDQLADGDGARSLASGDAP